MVDEVAAWVGWTATIEHDDCRPRAGLRATPRRTVLVRMDEDLPIPIDLETVTEARLVAQALAGSQSAFEQILRRYQRPVLSLLVRLTGDAGARGGPGAGDVRQGLPQPRGVRHHAPALELAVPHRPQHRHRRAAQGAGRRPSALDAGEPPTSRPRRPRPIRSSGARSAAPSARAGAAAARPADRRRPALRGRPVVRRDRPGAGHSRKRRRGATSTARARSWPALMTAAGWSPGR